MLFLAIVLLGCIGWQKIAVELVPPLAGDRLYVGFTRPGSDPEVIERELLAPLEARVGELPGVEETWGEIRGSTGTFQVRFAPGSDLKIRELDLQRLAAEITRTQPRGTELRVQAQDLAAASRFVMILNVGGSDDRNSLRTIIDERIEPRLAAVPGVSRVMTFGGSPQEITVRVDTD
ncbi:MAG: efflux RND transporter permease subunit, partial [bacterium]|nr:efflux RND transporter permease subunit [bacterium]